VLQLSYGGGYNFANVDTVFGICKKLVFEEQWLIGNRRD
jgi:hypothetical protein